MKRTLILLFTLMLALLTACGVWADTTPVPDSAESPVPQEPLAEEQEQETDSAALSALRQAAAEAGYPCAMAYLNFAFDAADFPEIPDALTESCPFLADAVSVDAGGEDIYAIVPTDSDAQLSVYRCELNEAVEMVVEDESICDVSGGGAVLLRCNISDIMPNTLVRVTDGSGASFEFSPFLSLENGRLGTTGVYDFTEYPLDMP